MRQVRDGEPAFDEVLQKLRLAAGHADDAARRSRASGGIARVDTIEDMTLVDITTLEGQPGFRSVAEWTAKASAGHWGHAHRRTIRFRALVELVEQDGAWKLAGITVVGAKQLG